MKIKNMLMGKILIVFLVILMIIPMTTKTYAYWSSNLTTTSQVATGTVTIGTWEQFSTVIPFDENTNYQVGESFSYAGTIWTVTGSWFDESKFLKNNGQVNYNYVRPYGPIGENTTEWRSFNTYYINDIVSHNGYDWIVLHEGANSAEPGTNSTAWNRLDETWFRYNTYEIGDVVLYSGQYYRALVQNRNKTPGSISWAWELVS